MLGAMVVVVICAEQPASLKNFPPPDELLRLIVVACVSEVGFGLTDCTTNAVALH